MGAGVQEEAENAVRRLCEAGDFHAATSAALRAYGPEVFGFLHASARSSGDADEEFSVFAEDFWKSLKTFAWGCSLRTWAYLLARRASSRSRRKRRRSPQPASSEMVGKLVQEVRTETLSFLRTEKRTRLRALRDSLAEEDQALLILRVDRGLAWDELARVLSEEDLDDEARKREAARLRKRFQLVKDKLKELAKREGLYPTRTVKE